MNILLGVTGSVASTLTPKMVAALQKAGHAVVVVSTNHALYFYRSSRLETYTHDRRWVVDSSGDNTALLVTDDYEWSGSQYTKGQEIPHVDISKWADALVIAPLSANTMAKMAYGTCDNLLTSLVLAWDLSKPIVIAPAMNTRMWQKSITQSNLHTVIDQYGATCVPPVVKELACGENGVGAMANIDDIVAAVEKACVGHVADQQQI